jgi:hypothetical protein
MRQATILLAALLVLSGCSHKVTVDSNGTTVTTSGTGDNQTVTVQGKEGTVVAGKGAVDTAKIGLPVYPGANAGDNVGYSGSSAQGSGAMAVLTTTDSFDKVYEWYKSQMPAGSEKMHMTADTGSTAMFQIGKDTDKEQKTVTISGEKDKTTIMLASGTKTN